MSVFTEERDGWDVVIGVLIAVLVVGGIYAMKRGAPEKIPATPLATSASSLAAPRVEVGDGSVHKPDDSVIAVAYECWADGQRILSDRPCGSDASMRTIAEPNRMDAQDTGGLYRPPARADSSSRNVSHGASSSFSESGACADIEREIDAINARMRQPYTNPQGERFRARLRDLSRARYEAKCIR